MIDRDILPLLEVRLYSNFTQEHREHLLSVCLKRRANSSRDYSKCSTIMASSSRLQRHSQATQTEKRSSRTDVDQMNDFIHCFCTRSGTIVARREAADSPPHMYNKACQTLPGPIMNEETICKKVSERSEGVPSQSHTTPKWYLYNPVQSIRYNNFHPKS